MKERVLLMLPKNTDFLLVFAALLTIGIIIIYIVPIFLRRIDPDRRRSRDRAKKIASCVWIVGQASVYDEGRVTRLSVGGIWKVFPYATMEDEVGMAVITLLPVGDLSLGHVTLSFRKPHPSMKEIWNLGGSSGVRFEYFPRNFKGTEEVNTSSYLQIVR